jgi:hypothetical protein
VPPRIRRWLAPPRHLLLVLAAVPLASASSLSWVGWELLRQDQAVEAQREQERLEHQADLAVQSLERLLAATEERLADWVSRPSDAVPEPVHGGHIVTFTGTTIQSNRSSPLLFYPYLPNRANPPSQLFADGEKRSSSSAITTVPRSFSDDSRSHPTDRCKQLP